MAVLKRKLQLRPKPITSGSPSESKKTEDWVTIARREHSKWRSPQGYTLSEAATGSYFAAVRGGYKGHMRMWTDVIEIAEEGIPKKVLEGVK